MQNKEKICRYVDVMMSMQYQLDKKLLGDDMLDETKLKKRKIAFCVEVGEFMNERPDLFKYWKKQISIDEEKALEEWVDVWHFALSLANHRKLKERQPTALNRRKVSIYKKSDIEDGLKLENIIIDLFTFVHSLNAEGLISSMIYIGERLGYDIEQVFDAYVKKNAVNVQRHENGY